ncbi:MAG: hypothetical protein IPJ00_15025 [Saprospirales bacterium]|nr:hypothetical protein [Saprospirales bacterium]
MPGRGGFPKQGYGPNLAFLEEYHLHFQPTSFVYIKTIEHNLDYANNPDARMTGILEKLYLKYQNEIKNYTY